MFHDQGLPVLKTLGFGNSVNITLGLPFIRVSVDHGTAYDIAKKFSANATTHVPLKEVSKNISTKKLENILKILINELKQKWKLKNPKICVLGLNPHAGENGFLGSEEIEVIKPVIDKLKKNKLNIDAVSYTHLTLPTNRGV